MQADHEQENASSSGAGESNIVVQGSVWATPSPVIEPKIVLLRWSVFELPGGAQHFVGYNANRGEGRVSTAIISWDDEQQLGVTQSGRRYQLLGEPGRDPDALYVWNECVHGSAYVDVTHQYTDAAPGLNSEGSKD